MGGISVISGDSHEIMWFTDTDRTGSMERVVAVVVRRPPKAAVPHAPRGQPSALARMALARAARDSVDGWSGAVGSDADQVRHSRDRAVIAASGREFSLPPDGQTLLLLIDASAPDGKWNFETHEVHAPEAPSPSPETSPETSPDRESTRTRMQEYHDATESLWHSWVEGEPFIRSFLNLRPNDGIA